MSRSLFDSLFNKGDKFGPVGSDGEGDRASANNSGIRSFSYSYNGSIGGNSFTRTAKAEDGKTILTLDKMEKHDYGTMSGEASPGFMSALEKLCADHRVTRWNGFDKYNPHVLDGDGFSLHIKYNNGKNVSAHGSNAQPLGFHKFVSDMTELFAPEEEKLLDIRKQELIAEGVSGKLQSVMINITKSEYGSDSYFLHFFPSSLRGGNFEARIKSYSGEFFPVGEHSLYTTVPDELLGFSDFDAIIKKYGLIKWFDYEAYEKDCEYFQLHFGYEKGVIRAHGSKHPDNYKEVRNALLTQVAKTVGKVEEYVKENEKKEEKQ